MLNVSFIWYCKLAYVGLIAPCNKLVYQMLFVKCF